MNARELLEALAALTPEQLELPVVMTHDAWQWVLSHRDGPKVAQWTGEHIGTPETAEKLAGEIEWMGEEYAASYKHPCIAIGYVE